MQSHEFHPSVLREYDVRGVVGDTLSTAEALSGLIERSAPPTTQKAQRFTELVAQHLDQDALFAALR